MYKGQRFSQLFFFLRKVLLLYPLNMGKGIFLSFTSYFLIHGMCHLYQGKALVTCLTKLSVAKHPVIKAQDYLCIYTEAQTGTDESALLTQIGWSLPLSKPTRLLLLGSIFSPIHGWKTTF